MGARPRELTAERAREALRRYHGRLLERVESGRLTAGEAKQLRDFAKETSPLDGGSRSAWAKNYTALAHEVGYSRQQLLTIRKAYKDDPRLPKTRANGAHNVSAWMQFLDAVGSKSGLQRAQGSNGAGAADDLPLPRKAKLELEKIKVSWPELNYATAKGVLILSPSKPAIFHRQTFRYASVSSPQEAPGATEGEPGTPPFPTTQRGERL